LKEAFFAWSTALGKIFTINNLRKWHIIVVDRCYMYKRNGESVDHLLLHYEVVVPYGMFYSVDLSCIELCLDE